MPQPRTQKGGKKKIFPLQQSNKLHPPSLVSSGLCHLGLWKRLCDAGATTELPNDAHLRTHSCHYALHDCTVFRIPLSAYLLVANCWFCLSDNVFNAPLFLKDIFSGCRIGHCFLSTWYGCHFTVFWLPLFLWRSPVSLTHKESVFFLASFKADFKFFFYSSVGMFGVNLLLLLFLPIFSIHLILF